LEKLLEKNYYLHKSAREAYRSFMQAYAQHSLKEVFDVHALDMVNVAKSFGFTVPPKVHLSNILSHCSQSIILAHRLTHPHMCVYHSQQR
jgi:hypothetical protein